MNDIDLNFKISDLKYFNNGETYEIKVSPPIIKSDDTNFPTLKNLFEYLKTKLNDNIQVIVSLYSSNTNDSNSTNADKNLIQQFQYHNIKDGKKIYYYVLIDVAFFTKINEEFYDIFNLKDIEINEIESDVNILKKYKIPENYDLSNKRKYSEYFDIFDKEIKNRLKDSDMYIYVLKLTLNDNIKKYIKLYEDFFDIFLFGGKKF